MTTRTESIPADVLGALALPDPDTLTEDQRRGIVCVWGSDRLDTVTAVDLGVQDDEGARCWFPRACPACTADRAHRALLDHASDCTDCRRVPAPGEPTVCEVARVLTRLVRGGRTARRSNRMRPTEGTPTR
ncbi:hypothetical protein ABZ173_10375 [Streptomyces rochei]|uniref:hypothetical protein n=1 Tax=Streptomyces rochei TaxID=1928 RepID=UPI0033A55A23